MTLALTIFTIVSVHDYTGPDSTDQPDRLHLPRASTRVMNGQVSGPGLDCTTKGKIFLEIPPDLPFILLEERPS
jgi:hypothetical protein